MSISRLVFGVFRKRLELKARLDALAPLGEGAVLSGAASVEGEMERAARRANGGGGERYRNVGEYDAVLRAHCRLDGER